MIFVNQEKIEFKNFNDGSFRVKYEVDPEGQHSHILWLYDGAIEALQLWYLVKHIHERMPDQIIDLEMPYCCDARMDRCQNRDEVFTLKYFADLLNALPLHSVKVFDPHSHVCEALINRLIVETPIYNLHLMSELYPKAVWFFPDAGAEKRYGPMVPNKLSCFGVKHRDWDTQEIHDLSIFGAIESIKNNDIIICDDIVSRGSTLYSAAKQLKELGANNIYVYVSHCENTVLQPHINGKSLLDYDLITKLYTTNSIYRAEHPKIHVIETFLGGYNA